MNAASPVLELFADPRAVASRSLDDLAEALLRRAAEPRPEWSVALADLPDPHARSLFRSLLACLARKSAQESGTVLDPYGGSLAFVRDTPAGPVRVDGTFDNRAGTARLTLPPPVPYPEGRARSGERGASVVDAFAPAVVDYWIDDTAFSLASDLARLDRVRTAGAAESAVLYCNRIVEAMARRTVGPAARSATPSLAGLINDLVKYHDLPQPLKRLLHSLRALGNDARHAIQPVTAAEVDVAFAVLLRWLHWSFCESASGPRLLAINRPNRPTDELLPPGLAGLVEAAAAGEAVLAQLTAEHAGAAPVTPTLLAAAAEGLIDRKDAPAARGVLDAGLSRFPRDRRLRQLNGLYWSWRGEAETNIEYLYTARAELEPLLPQSGAVATDEETFGILGGVYKRLSDQDKTSSRDWLWQSHRTYRTGWEQSRRTNDYLGINAATTAFLLGLNTVAAVAEPICDGLASQAARLRADGRALEFWDQLTWAEALLLRREFGPAGEQYRDAFGRSPDRTRAIGSAATQARRILDQMGESSRAAEVLGPWADAGR